MKKVFLFLCVLTVCVSAQSYYVFNKFDTVIVAWNSPVVEENVSQYMITTTDSLTHATYAMTLTNWKVGQITGKWSTEYEFTNPVGHYIMTIQAYNTAGWSLPSDPVFIYVKSTPPAKPVSVRMIIIPRR